MTPVYVIAIDLLYIYGRSKFINVKKKINKLEKEKKKKIRVGAHGADAKAGT